MKNTTLHNLLQKQGDCRPTDHISQVDQKANLNMAQTIILIGVQHLSHLPEMAERTFYEPTNNRKGR